MCSVLVVMFMFKCPLIFCGADWVVLLFYTSWTNFRARRSSLIETCKYFVFVNCSLNLSKLSCNNDVTVIHCAGLLTTLCFNLTLFTLFSFLFCSGQMEFLEISVNCFKRQYDETDRGWSYMECFSSTRVKGSSQPSVSQQ